MNLIKTLTFAGCLFFCLKLDAQTKRLSDNDSLVLITLAQIAGPDSIVERKLVELALKSPAFNASDHRNKIYELELKKAKNSWLNLLSISTNYNDQSFAKNTNVNAPVVYPKYFFGLTIPLGIFFQQGNTVKTAKQAIALGKNNQEEVSRNLKAEVLGKYKEYKMLNVLIQMQSELINDVLANVALAERSFKEGKIAVDTYISTLKSKNEESAKFLNLKHQQDLLKLDIERLIGVPLESVLTSAAAEAATSATK